MKKNNRYLFLAVLGVQLLVLLILCGIGKLRKTENLTFDSSRFEGEYPKWDGEAWTLEAKDFPVDERTLVLTSPKFSARKGTYTLTVFYECEQTQPVTIRSDSDKTIQSQVGVTRLSPGNNVQSFRFSLKEDVSDLRVCVFYEGNSTGTLKIRTVMIEKTGIFVTQLAALLSLAFFFADLLLLSAEDLKKKPLAILILILGAVVTSLWLFIPGIWYFGHDVQFHLMRIAGLAEELKNGTFPVRISSFWGNGYGYPVSVFYGDVFLYLPALFYLAGIPLVMAAKLFVAAVNAGSVFLAYACFKRILKKRNAAAISAFAYVTAAYRMFDLQIRFSVGEFLALVFLPLLLLAVYRIYTEDVRRSGYVTKNAFLFAAAVTAILASHILTLEMCVILLALFCLICFKKTFRARTLLTFVLAGAESLLFNLYFLVPFLNYYLKEPVQIKYTVAGGTKKIQEEGASLLDLLSLFPGTKEEIGDTKWMLTPGVLLMGTLVAGLAVIVVRKAQKELRIFWGFGLLTLILSTKYVPYDLLSKTAAGNLLAQIQFPWRFLGLCVLFLSVLLGMLLRNLKKRKAVFAVVGLVCFLAGCMPPLVYVNTYRELKKESLFVDYTEGNEMDTAFYSGREYLPADSDPYAVDYELKTEGEINVTLLKAEGLTRTYLCDAKEAGILSLPVFFYHGYEVTDETGTSYELGAGENGRIRVIIPKEYEGTLTLCYHVPFIWNLAAVLSVLGFLTMAFISGKNRG